MPQQSTTSPEDHALLALANGESKTAVASSLAVSRATLARWIGRGGRLQSSYGRTVAGLARDEALRKLADIQSGSSD